jgi:phosphate:Na+ symporter
MEETVANDENDEMLLELTSERSQLMDDLRNRLLYDETTNVAERKSLYVSTRVFERVLWQLRQMLISKQQNA